MPANSLALRLVAGAALWIAAALLAGGALLSSLFRESAERSFDARLVVLLESLVAVSDLGADGALRLTRAVGEPRFEQVYSGWYWQIDVPGAEPLRSRSLWDQSLAAEGLCEGSLVPLPRGPGGFGYDPVFVPDGSTRTMAELTDEEKDRISHRGRAFRALAHLLAGD